MGFHLGSAHILLADVGYLQDFSAHHFPNILGEEVETNPCLPIEFHIHAKISGEESYETECNFKPADSQIFKPVWNVQDFVELPGKNMPMVCTAGTNAWASRQTYMMSEEAEVWTAGQEPKSSQGWGHC